MSPFYKHLQLVASMFDRLLCCIKTILYLSLSFSIQRHCAWNINGRSHSLSLWMPRQTSQRHCTCIRKLGNYIHLKSVASVNSCTTQTITEDISLRKCHVQVKGCRKVANFAAVFQCSSNYLLIHITVETCLYIHVRVFSVVWNLSPNSEGRQFEDVWNKEWNNRMEKIT